MARFDLLNETGLCIDDRDTMLGYFAVKDRVKVIKPGLYTSGWEGTVTRLDDICNLVSVRFKGGEEFNYSPTSLEIILKSSNNKKKGNNKMNKVELKDYKKVARIRMSDRLYDYALYDEPVEPGSYVFVTGVASGAVWVVEDVVDKTCRSHPVTEEVCGVVDFSCYEARKAVRKKRENLKKQLDEKIKALDEMDKYARYAELDPEFKALYDELKELV